MVDVFDGLFVGNEEDFFLFLDDVAQFFDVQDIVVNEGVHACVAEVVGTVVPYFALFVFQTQPDVLEMSGIAFLERNQVIVSDNQGDLFYFYFVGSFVEGQ